MTRSDWVSLWPLSQCGNIWPSSRTFLVCIPAAPLRHLVLCVPGRYTDETLCEYYNQCKSRGVRPVSDQHEGQQHHSWLKIPQMFHFFFLSKWNINAQTFCSPSRFVGSFSVSGCSLLVYITYWSTHNPAVCLSVVPYLALVPYSACGPVSSGQAMDFTVTTP